MPGVRSLTLRSHTPSWQLAWGYMAQLAAQGCEEAYEQGLGYWLGLALDHVLGSEWHSETSYFTDLYEEVRGLPPLAA